MASGGAAPAPLPCLEVFDENSQPSVEEISEYAQQIGIDPLSETHLLPLAKDGLMQALPSPWKAYYDDKLKVHYFYNPETKITQWDHPLDQVYKSLVVKARQASERGDSFVDDTCISIQDLLTFEEDPKQVPDGKSVHKFHDDDSSINNSLEEEISSSKNEPKDALLKKMHQNMLEKKSLPSLKPIAGNAENKLGFLNNLRRNAGESNTFPRTAQNGINKFKNFSYLQKTDCDDSNKSDDMVAQGSENPIKNSQINPKNLKLVKQTSEIIDLSFNPKKKDDSLGDEQYKPAVKKGITLTGGGSIFLKSNRLSQSMSVEGKPDSSTARLGHLNLGDNPKGILRERSFGEVQLKSSYVDKNDNGKILDTEDDKKSVRFNLEKQDMEIQYDYSPSPSSNSSSDVLLGNNQNSVILKNKTEKQELFTNRTVARRNSESSITSEIPNFVKNGKLKPLVNNEGGKPSNQLINTDQSAKSAQFGVRTKSEDIPSGSPTRRIIRPNPGDFIKPNLFQKPFEKLSDILKTNSPDSDSESDKPVNNSSPPPTVKRKLSINLMESVDSEASIESPDKDINALIDNGSKLSYEKKVNQNLKDRRLSVPTMTMVDEDNSYGNVKNYKNEMTSLKNAEISNMKHRMEKELNEIKHNLEKGFENELRILRDILQREHAKNKSDLNQAIVSAQSNHDSNIKEALERMRFELNVKKERLLHYEEMKHTEELESLTKLLNEEHLKNIEKLKQDKKNQLMVIAGNLEKENMKSINDLKMQYADNFEVEKLRLIVDNKSTLDKMKIEHESVCDELRKDYRSEVELVRGQQAAHLSALRDKMRREREPPRPPTVLSPPSVLSPRDDTSYERLRCDKRLLEDKYRCLKEKYARLKSDVKISIERRNKRREQSLTTGSETEKSHSHHKSGENGDPNVLNKDCPNRGRSHIIINDSRPKNGNNNEVLSPTSREACQENNNSKIDGNASHSESAPPQNGQCAVNSNLLTIAKRNLNVVSPDCSRGKSPSFRDKSPMGRNRQKSFNGETDNSIGVNDVSLSHSESQTVSNKYKRVNIVENFKENGERSKSNMRKFRKDDAGYADTTLTDYHDSSDTGTSEQCHLKESLVGKNRKKLFTRLKSASTSRLNYTVSSKVTDRACSPVENLRQQLRKLEDLEEQFPDVALNADTTAYRLRYPFPDQGNSGVSGGELGFLRHRALVEREGVRRARAVLRRRADVLRQRRRSPAAWQEECELTDMEVSLHRTKSILGEKVIRLRHIEKSLRRIQDGQEPKDSKTDSNLPKQREADYKDTTLSDISSHSSGFSSTEGNSDNNRNAKHVHSTPDYEHSSEIINSLQTLNTEIRDIWQVLNSQQQMNVAKVIPIGQMLYTDVGWQLPIAASNIPNIQNLPSSVSINMPGLSENKLQSYRQVNNIGPKMVQAAAPVGVATSLVERTRDLRDWLKQQAAL